MTPGPFALSVVLTFMLPACMQGMQQYGIDINRIDIHRNIGMQRVSSSLALI